MLRGGEIRILSPSELIQEALLSSGFVALLRLNPPLSLARLKLYQAQQTSNPKVGALRMRNEG